MNGDLTSNNALLQQVRKASNEIEGVDLVVCPTLIHLSQALEQTADSSIAVGAQNVSDKSSGAYTGEVSAEMLKELGATYVLIGHSERRSLFNETDELIVQKVESALSAGLIPVVCAGETLEERQQGATESVISTQINMLLSRCSIEMFAQIVIAYEPVWAIGTGMTATPQQAQP